MEIATRSEPVQAGVKNCGEEHSNDPPFSESNMETDESDAVVTANMQIDVPAKQESPPNLSYVNSNHYLELQRYW